MQIGVSWSLQGRLISWAPERKLGAHANFSDRILLAPRYQATVPGYPPSLRVSLLSLGG